MSEIKKVATRDSYGNALVELGKEHDDLIVLDADLQKLPRRECSKKLSRSAIGILVLQRQI